MTIAPTALSDPDARVSGDGDRTAAGQLKMLDFALDESRDGAGENTEGLTDH